MCLKGLVTAAFGSFEPFYIKGKMGVSCRRHPYFREATDSLILKTHFHDIC